MTKNVIILSHRRSGTHLTIDSIYNNFKTLRQKPYINIDETRYYIKKPLLLDDFKKKLSGKPRIIKSHYLPDFSNYYQNEKEILWVKSVFRNSYIIYVYRNGLDVMVSLYEYFKSFSHDYKDISFTEFLLSSNTFEPNLTNLNIMEYWAYHINSWQNSEFYNQILFIKFEELISNYNNTLMKLANYLNLKTDPKIKDIRIKKTKTIQRLTLNSLRMMKGIKKTSVSARKGKIGDNKNYFSEEDRELFFYYNKEIMQRLNYLR